MFPSRDFDLAVQVEDAARGRESVAPAREIEASMPANARSRGYAPCRHHGGGHRGGGWVLKAAFVTARTLVPRQAQPQRVLKLLDLRRQPRLRHLQHCCRLREALQLRHRDEGAQRHCFSVRSKGSPDMPAYSARANERLRTSDAGILQTAKAADRYDDIRRPWRLRMGGDYPGSTLARQV